AWPPCGSDSRWPGACRGGRPAQGEVRRRSLPRRVSFFVPMLTAALIVVGWRAASAGPCISDGQTCRTDQSCCSGVCVKSTKKSFGTCATQCCVRSSPMGAFDTCTVETPVQCAAQGGIAQGSGSCSPKPCPPSTTPPITTPTPPPPPPPLPHPPPPPPPPPHPPPPPPPPPPSPPARAPPSGEPAPPFSPPRRSSVHRAGCAPPPPTPGPRRGASPRRFPARP